MALAVIMFIYNNWYEWYKYCAWMPLFKNTSSAHNSLLRGKGGVPWVQIMENELEYLADRGGHGGHLGEKFVKKYCS